jgi:hypothetical protein
MACELTPEQRAALELKLAAAEEAYHQSMIGGGVREFTDQNGERIAYSAANSSRLLAYIAWLRSQLGYPAYCNPYHSRPAGVIF